MVVLRGIAEGNYDGRVDAATIEDPGLRAIAEAVNGAASATVADLRQAHQRVQIVTAGVDEAIEAMIRLVIQGDLSGSVRIGVDRRRAHAAHRRRRPGDGDAQAVRQRDARGGAPALDQRGGGARRGDAERVLHERAGVRDPRDDRDDGGAEGRLAPDRGERPDGRRDRRADALRRAAGRGRDQGLHGLDGEGPPQRRRGGRRDREALEAGRADRHGGRGDRRDRRPLRPPRAQRRARGREGRRGGARLLDRGRRDAPARRERHGVDEGDQEPHHRDPRGDARREGGLRRQQARGVRGREARAGTP